MPSIQKVSFKRCSRPPAKVEILCNLKILGLQLNHHSTNPSIYILSTNLMKEYGCLRNLYRKSQKSAGELNNERPLLTEF